MSETRLTVSKRACSGPAKSSLAAPSSSTGIVRSPRRSVEPSKVGVDFVSALATARDSEGQGPCSSEAVKCVRRNRPSSSASAFSKPQRVTALWSSGDGGWGRSGSCWVTAPEAS
jgi:hypothetical protein